MALVQRGDETITVSTTAIGFTAAEIAPTNEFVREAKVYIESGGPVRWNANQDPTAGGSEGSPLAYAKTTLHVVGSEDLANFKMIKDTGVSDATVRVAYFGTGGS
jgi:hypothetical protein